jgi:hypothetical protein
MTPPHYQPEMLALHRGAVRTKDRPNLYDTLAERERIARICEEIRHDLRVMWWQSFVRRACIAVAVFAVVYFAVRGAF